jgi:regulator of CtrA degradation
MLRRAQTAHRNTVSFGDHLASSETFKLLFREGMLLVEEAASYLDGPGRRDSRALPHAEAIAYASESMRLTTRLMQLAAWLLLQRAVNEGDMTLAQAQTDKHRVNLTRQDFATSGDVFAKLPERLLELAHQSKRLQDRILHLDQLIHGAEDEAPAAPAIHSQIESLRAAFDVRAG